jgi:hypothetical protein
MGESDNNASGENVHFHQGRGHSAEVVSSAPLVKSQSGFGKGNWYARYENQEGGRHGIGYI